MAAPAVEPESAKQDAAPAQPLRDARPQPEKKKVILPAAKPVFTPPPTQAKLQAEPAQPHAFEEDKARQRRDESSEEKNEQKDLLQKEVHANVREAPAFAPKPAAPPATTASGAVAFAPPAASPSSAAASAAPAARAAVPAGEMRLKREAVAADAQAPIDEATRELEAIAKLRAEGRYEEADKALAEFKRKRPDYRIPDAMWERIKPR